MNEVTERLCPKCGAAVPHDARFCPRCGTAFEQPGEPPVAAAPAVAPAPVAVPPPAPASAPPPRQAQPPRKASIWRALGVPIAIFVLVVIIWAVLAGMPFGSREENARPLQPQVETVGEGTTTTAAPPPPPMTASPAPEPLPPMTNTILMPEPQPPMTTMPPVVVPPPASTQPPAPVPIPQPPPAPVPAPQPPPPSEPREISVTEAKGALARYVDGRDPYHIPGNCIAIRGGDHVNRGYTFEVYDTCDSRRLGLWRVDSVTREVFEQQADGRYLRP